MVQKSLEYNFNEQLFTLADDEIVRVVYTQPHREGLLYEFCQKQAISCYLPLKKAWKPMAQRHGDKVYQYPREVLKPMFPNYMFVKMTPEQRSLIFRSNAVIRILSHSEDEQKQLLREIQVIKQIETIAMSEEIQFNVDVREGDRFLIESGPWAGVYGWLKKKSKRFLWTVEIECVNSSVQATIDPSLYKITPLPS